ncbi:MAG: hypothetical protein HY744_33990 [Deltaproteobacteria bacterium]|nr:hypothetical protein [Deltaproteobacteria bacterium]
MFRSGFLLCCLGVLTAAAGAGAEVPAAAPGARSQGAEVERAVVRWHARATGGVARPQFIFARELGFEARLEAMAEKLTEAPYADRHVRAAIERHITETILAQLPVQPAPTPAEVAEYAERARGRIEQAVGGRQELLAAARAEGVDADELGVLLRRRARADLYLHRMVAPMLEPSETDLREALRRGGTPYGGRRYEEIAPELRRWLVSSRLQTAMERYYSTARTRVVAHLIGRMGAPRP